LIADWKSENFKSAICNQIRERRMKHLTSRWVALVFALSAILFLGACHKKAAPPPPPPPPPPPAPTATLTASPEAIDKGQSATLTWQTSNATDVSIDSGVGAVQPNGSQQVTPADSTTYTLTAKGAGGTQTATARVTVNAPPPPPPPPPQATLTDEQLFAQNVRDVYFDYDKSDVRGDQQSVVQADAAFLQQHPNMTFTVEGHCDERGSTEYNLALGDNRASAVKNALVAAGVSADRVKTVSFGKEKPFCTESNESCWQQNRRGHFVLSK
jgi:peptidoglycan-associated lipoprotein